MGMTETPLVFKSKLSLALSLIVADIRNAMVVIVGLAAVPPLIAYLFRVRPQHGVVGS
jgi:ABC-type proline/glycine betaine transport system permease subunit